MDKVAQGKMASPLDHNPSHLTYWSKDTRDSIFGLIPNAFSSKFPGFSVCHYGKRCNLLCHSNNTGKVTFIKEKNTTQAVEIPASIKENVHQGKKEELVRT